MKNVRLAGRYAKALFDFAIEQNQIEQVYEDISLTMGLLKFNKELNITIECPVIPESKKVKIFTEIFEGKVSKVSFGFLRLVLDKKREPALLLICEEFIKLYYKLHNIKVVQFITAQQASEEIVANMKTLVEEKTGANVEVQTIITPGIIGGFIIKIGDFVYDASILRHVNKLKREFSHNIYQAGF
ncbi:MAG: ATP synthase F1 subunit delta [Bacteroidales bacterium]|jgi:F-type H+-transporting ATPase subunit delta|nr:ATP synthase F1 subunit delta [Bacteroidales bacterium]